MDKATIKTILYMSLQKTEIANLPCIAWRHKLEKLKAALNAEIKHF